MPDAASTADRIDGALPPPPGVTPNFINPSNHDANWIALHTICLTLITFLVGMRLGIRWLVVYGLGVDDCELMCSTLSRNYDKILTLVQYSLS